MLQFLLEPVGFLTGALLCLLLWSAMAYFAILRLQRKLGAGGRPTIWSYLNELGGYVVVGVVLAGATLAAIVRLLTGA